MLRTSLVVQWFRIYLAMQGMQVQILVGELRYHMLQLLSLCALKPMYHNQSLGATTREACQLWAGASVPQLLSL